MPLSEDEQRILRQIEEQLQRDPGFARTTRTKETGSRRSFGLALFGLVVALLATILSVIVSPFVSFACFIAAVALGVVAERQARMAAQQGLENLQSTVRDRFNGPRRPPQAG
ncbi:MAG: DUF3040 domain-containing protein [Ilumatobacteraceae bacterium]